MNQICGDRKDDGTFVKTGNMKGHYPVNVCDKSSEHGGKHKDSASNKTWH